MKYVLVLLMLTGCSSAQWRESGQSAARSFQIMGEAMKPEPHQAERIPNNDTNCVSSIIGNQVYTNCY